MPRGARRRNESVESVFKEAEQNLLSAFEKSSKTHHPGLKGDARAYHVKEFLEKRLPSEYGVQCRGEIVDYLDNRSGEFDIVVFDKVRNAVLSDNPLWIPAESALCIIEVKSCLSKSELRKAFGAAKKIDSLRPYKRQFTVMAASVTEDKLSGKDAPKKVDDSQSLRCFRTVFAYQTDITPKDWLAKEWKRILAVALELKCKPAVVDRVIVLNRGMINVPASQGTDHLSSTSILQQWFINLVNILERENSRRTAVDLQTYTKQNIPGWKKL